MTVKVYTTPIVIYPGGEKTINVSVNIESGGTGRTFTFRIGPKGTQVPYVNATMTETNSTISRVDLSVTLTSSQTAAIKKDTDFQICIDSPKDVLAEGKIKLDYSIGPL